LGLGLKCEEEGNFILLTPAPHSSLPPRAGYSMAKKTRGILKGKQWLVSPIHKSPLAWREQSLPASPLLGGAGGKGLGFHGAGCWIAKKERPQRNAPIEHLVWPFTICKKY